MDVNTIGFIPLTSFPFPYKYLMGIGFYFYIKSLVEKKENVISKKEYLLFLPAILYGLLRLYWYLILHLGIDRDIFWNVYQTRFFTYNELIYLIFSLVVMFFATNFLKKNSTRIRGSISVRKNWSWLTTFSRIFIAFIILNITHQITAIAFNLEDSGQFYSLILVFNSVFIYWIGFIGFTKSNLLFRTFSFKNEPTKATDSLKSKLEHLVMNEEVFANQNLKVSQLASLLEIGEKQLSLYMHETYKMSFVDYINIYRVEKVKALLLTSEQQKYTLLAIAEKCGFNSKSSFNAVFKKVTGVTPTQYRKKHKS